MEILPYEPGHEVALQNFLARSFPESPLKADPAFFRWRFLENPLGPSLPQYLLAVSRGEIVGQMAALRDRLRCEGTWHECRWLIDLFVAPEHRGGLTALQLFRAHMEASPLLMVVGAGPNLMPLYTALGWRHQHVADTVFAVFEPKELLALAATRGESDLGPLVSAASPMARTLQALRSGLALFDGRFRIETSRDLPQEWDALHASLEPELGTTTFRSPALMQWKMDRHPFSQRFHVLLRSTRDERAVAVASVKLMRRGSTRWAEVVDYLADPHNAQPFHALMTAVATHSRYYEVHFVRVRCSLPVHIASLRPPFWISKNRPVIDDLLIYSRDRELLDAVTASRPWHLTSLVSDRTDHGADEWAAARKGGRVIKSAGAG